MFSDNGGPSEGQRLQELYAENRKLREQVEALQAEVARLTARLDVAQTGRRRP